MPGQAPRRCKMDENGTMRSAFRGKLPEEFTEQDVLAFAADTGSSSFPEGIRRNPRRHPCGGL